MRNQIRSFATTTKLDIAKAKGIWKRAQAVCFDVDSTVATEEGIEVLAEYCGAGAAVRDWTNRAMGGEVPFRKSLVARLDLMRPSEAILQTCLKEHPASFTPGFEKLISELRARDIDVFLVSGGFRQMIAPLAKLLNVPESNIYANNLLFGTDGEYVGFDPDEPTSSEGGKARVAQSLKDKFGYDPLVMIGDGATDMEARPPADVFIGYGGVVERAAVAKGADWFVHDWEPLLSEMRPRPKV